MYIKQRIGIIGEEIASNYLKSINYEILDRNFNCKQGEIDIIAKDKEEYVKSNMLNGIKLEKGDLVYANTSIYPNDFCVGFVDSVHSDKTVIREIGSKRLCDYYNESFTKINKEKLGYEILEGVQYQTYKKVLKAFSNIEGRTRFRSIEFDGNKCTVTSRNKFENEISGTVEFEYNSKTTIKHITNLLNK